MVNFSWVAIVTILKVLYGTCMLVLMIYGFNSLALLVLYLRNRRKLKVAQPPADPAGREWPRVTIQLPFYNEGSMIDRLLAAVTGLDYPHDRLEIQVLDDSTDGTRLLAAQLVERYQINGFDIHLIHRDCREGYKAGALLNGLTTANGEFIAVFDADFIPPADWLRSVIPAFVDDSIGCVQTRWGYLNSNENWLTRAENLALDGHFIVEQGGRCSSGLFMGFNGSGGVWRRAAIQQAGGWSSDTITEDLDLSYRAQMAGWRIAYLPQTVVPGELPTRIDDFKTQQYRWAKGTIQTWRKLGGRLADAKQPWYRKVMGLIHLGMYFPFVAAVLSLLLTLPMAIYFPRLMVWFPLTFIASFGPPALYLTAQTESLPRLGDRLARLPILTLLGIGVSFNNALAVLAGLVFNGGEFVRTPKGMATVGSAGKPLQKGHRSVSGVWGEVLMAGYAIFSAVRLYSLPNRMAFVPGLLVYAGGYSLVAGTSLVQRWRQHRPGKRTLSIEELPV